MIAVRNGIAAVPYHSFFVGLSVLERLLIKERSLSDKFGFITVLSCICIAIGSTLLFQLCKLFRVLCNKLKKSLLITAKCVPDLSELDSVQLCIDLFDLSLVTLDTVKHRLTLVQELFCLLFIAFSENSLEICSLFFATFVL